MFPSLLSGMKMQTLFYLIGLIFLFATVSYFSYQYLFNLADSIKTIVLVLLIIIFFVTGNVMEERSI